MCTPDYSTNDVVLIRYPFSDLSTFKVRPALTYIFDLTNRKPTFQSTPPHGERHRDRQASGWGYAFQSTPPHGERPEPY